MQAGICTFILSESRRTSYIIWVPESCGRSVIQRPFYFLVISCFTNIALDLLFVVGLRMGVRGAAVATILSQVVSACLVLGTLMRADGSYRFEIRKTRITPVILVRIIRIGFPADSSRLCIPFPTS